MSLLTRLIAALIAALVLTVGVWAQVVITPATTASGTTAPSVVAQTSFLTEGGQITWSSAYSFQVSAAEYYIEGQQYSASETDLTLSAADMTNDRIDVVVVNTSGQITVVEGTAAAQPSEPDIDPGTQLKLGIILVEAASAAPSTVTNTVVYAENAGHAAEWDCTEVGTGFTLNSTAAPRTGTISIEGTAATSTSTMDCTKGAGGTFDPNSASVLILNIRSKATWANNRGLQVTLRTSDVLEGVQQTISRTGTWGFESSITGSYQQVAIPIQNFAVPAGTTINEIRIQPFGGGIGFYIDDISFQGGGATQVQTGLTQDQADALYVRILADPGLLTSLDLLSTGVRQSATDGVWTILGLGNGSDENLTLDLDNAGANTILFDTGTGVTAAKWDFDLNPNADATWDLGSSSLAWQDAYLNQLVSPPDSDGTTGASKTIDFASGSMIRTVTLGADTTMTLSGMKSGGRYIVVYDQGSGGFQPTYTNTILWENDTAFAHTQTASAVDICVFIYSGTTLYGTCGANFGTP